VAAGGFEVRPVTGIGEVSPGDDLAEVIATAAPWLEDGDILVVTSKIVSKAEGRLVPVPPEEGPAREAAREAALATETARVVARRGRTQIVQTHHGLVLASAGIDASNVDSSRMVLLPKDPDGSARALRDAIRGRTGVSVAVVITDTMGRPWRLGLTDVAIGAAGVDGIADYRGLRDPYGNELQLTEVAVIDELAGAADLVKGKTDQVPVAVVRGVPVRPDGTAGQGASALVRGADADLFSMGTAEAIAVGMRAAANVPDAAEFPPGAAVVNVSPEAPFVAGDDPRLMALAPPGTARILVPWAAAGDSWAIARTGARVQRLRAELAADGLASAWVPADAALVSDLVDLPWGTEPLGLLAIGPRA
jgi:coenzyme F420-0:L-glutamate ligase/coenzyme F420-1:gamma-L-glutamate ligase